MLGWKERDQLELFMAGSLRQRVPDDHILFPVDRVLDLSWLREAVADRYCGENGRPGIDPEVAIRLMLAGFLLGIVHHRRLMREAQVNIAIRWFVGYGLHEPLPDHSSLTRIRQRRGAERFRRIFEKTVKACIVAKIATGEVVHIDASLIRADVSWESLAARHFEAVAKANELDPGDAKKESRETGKYKKVCITDSDATMATASRTTLPTPLARRTETILAMPVGSLTTRNGLAAGKKPTSRYCLPTSMPAEGATLSMRGFLSYTRARANQRGPCDCSEKPTSVRDHAE
jgi:transposase